MILYAYMKYRYTKYAIYMVSDIIQSVLLSIFMMNTILISSKRYDESVDDSYQYTGICSILLLLLLEYLMTTVGWMMTMKDNWKRNSYKKMHSIESKQYTFIVTIDDSIHA